MSKVFTVIAMALLGVGFVGACAILATLLVHFAIMNSALPT